MTPDGYYDYLYETTNLVLASTVVEALQDSAHLANMLGNLISLDTTVVVRGSPGIAAYSYTDPEAGSVITVPAVGDPAILYFTVRTTVPPEDLGFDPCDYGLVPSYPLVNNAVLGVWAW